MVTTRLRIVSFAAALAVGAACVDAKATGPTLVFEPATGLVLSQDRAGESWYPASLTKLMTAYLVFRKIRAGEMRLDQQIPITAFANGQQPSKIGIRPGRAVTVDFALQLMLVYSANDMAVVLAEAAGGTTYKFVGEMNRAARLMGLTGTHFANPNGLFDPRQVSTARDMAILVSAILADFPEHAHYFSQAHVEVGRKKLRNRNGLIRLMPEADGMKTGFVCNSGFNLIGSASRNGKRLVVIILGADSAKARADLAQMLLTDGLVRLRPPSHPRLAVIDNKELGSAVPPDMTARVCRRKPPVAMARARDLGGWGISLGNFATADNAGLALRGGVLSPLALEAAGDAGVVRMPGKASFAAMLWNLDQTVAEALCADFRRRKLACEMMTPETFKQIASLSSEPAPKPQKPLSQGSDADPGKKKKKTK